MVVSTGRSGWFGAGAALAQRRLRGRARLRVEASWSAGELTSPKSRKVRSVRLAEQPAAVLAGLASRERFTARDDLVFRGAVGEPRTRPAYVRCASTTCATRSPRWSSASSTSPRSRHSWATRRSHDRALLHVRSRHDDAARMTRLFESSVLETPSRELKR